MAELHHTVKLKKDEVFSGASTDILAKAVTKAQFANKDILEVKLVCGKRDILNLKDDEIIYPDYLLDCTRLLIQDITQYRFKKIKSMIKEQSDDGKSVEYIIPILFQR